MPKVVTNRDGIYITLTTKEQEAQEDFERTDHRFTPYGVLQPPPRDTNLAPIFLDMNCCW